MCLVTSLFGFEGRIWDLIVSVPDHCLSFYFGRLALKDEQFRSIDPVTDTEIDVLKRHLRERFPELALGKLQKVHTKKVKAYTDWLEAHCQQRQYTFQIHKCGDENCCLPSTLTVEEMKWLPDPVIDETDPDHFKPYSEVKNIETTEDDRPSLKKSVTKETVVNEAPVKKRRIGPEVQTDNVVHVNSNTVDLETVNSEGPENMSTVDPESTETVDPENVHTVDPENLNATAPPENITTAQDMANTRTDGTKDAAVTEVGAEYQEETEDPLPAFGEYNMCVKPHARATVSCVECRKPRVLYSRFKLTDRQLTSLVMLLSGYDYTCGAPITPLHTVCMAKS